MSKAMAGISKYIKTLQYIIVDTRVCKYNPRKVILCLLIIMSLITTKQRTSFESVTIAESTSSADIHQPPKNVRGDSCLGVGMMRWATADLV